MYESDPEETKDGYLSDDLCSQKTPNPLEVEQSEDLIENADAVMKEDEKYSANFSDG